MATFGGASDAVAAAVAIQQAIGRLNRSSTAPLEVRIGISGGDVVFEGEDCFGTPVIEAARLCGAAQGGQTLASEMVRWLARGGEGSFTPLGNVELKGLPEPVPIVEVGWEPVPQSSVPLPTFLTDIGRIFVGRDGELERLGQLWNEATAGELRVALVAGEPGVGKTRLAAELARMVHDQGATVLAGRCDEDLGVPYQPFVEALRHFVDHAAELSERLGRYGGELARLVPELSVRIPGLSAPIRSDPEMERYRLFDAVAAWLTATSHEEPVLLVLDDLQWAAKPTLMLLRHVSTAAAGGRVLVLGTYRDTELTHDHPLLEVVPDLRRQGGVERLSLTGLDDVGVAALVEAASGRALSEAGLALARAVYEETEGNPFFVREVLRHLAETGAVEREAGTWTTRLPVDQLGIPEGVRDVVGRRLARLSEETNRVLRVASVAGPEFELGVVQAAGDLSEETLLGAIEEAADARVVSEVSAGRLRFAHALVRATLYESLTRARQVALHRRTAEAIETIHEAALDDYVPALAYHFSRAPTSPGEPLKAVEYTARAGDQALAQLAHDEAVRYYRQALELLEVGGVVGQEARRLEFLIALGEAERRAADPAYRDTLLGAASLAEQLGDADALARAALANHRGWVFSAWGTVDAKRVAALEAALDALGDRENPMRARLLARLGLELVFTADRERRVKLSHEALAMARRLGDPGVLAEVHQARFLTICAPDNLAERVGNTAELLSVADRLNDPVVTSLASVLRHRAAMELGDVEEAYRHLEVCQRVGAELGQPMVWYFIVMHAIAEPLLTGNIPKADRAAAAFLELGEIQGQPDVSVFSGVQQFWIRYEQGRLDELEQLFLDLIARYPEAPLVKTMLALLYCELDRSEEARSIWDLVGPSLCGSLPVNQVWAMTVTNGAATCAALGDTDRAAALDRLLSPYGDQMVYAFGVSTGFIAHYLGLLAVTLGRIDEAEARFAAAAAAHERIGAPAWLARTRLAWARMLLARLRPEDAERARGLLDQALATARSLGLAGVERHARSLHEQLEASR